MVDWWKWLNWKKLKSCLLHWKSRFSYSAMNSYRFPPQLFSFHSISFHQSFTSLFSWRSSLSLISWATGQAAWMKQSKLIVEWVDARQRGLRPITPSNPTNEASHSQTNFSSFFSSVWFVHCFISLDYAGELNENKGILTVLYKHEAVSITVLR